MTVPGPSGGAATNPVRYEVPRGDFGAFLQGFWKRNLEWRSFGGAFQHLRATNNVVLIEEDVDAAHQPNTRCVIYCVRFRECSMVCYALLWAWSYWRT